MNLVIFFLLITFTQASDEICNYPNTDLCLGYSAKIPERWTRVQLKSRLGAILKNTTVSKWDNMTLVNSTLKLGGDGKIALLVYNTSTSIYFNETVQMMGRCLTIMQCQAEGKPYCSPYSDRTSPPGGKAKKGSYLQWRPCVWSESQKFVLNPPCAPGCSEKDDLCKKECQSRYCFKGRNITCTGTPTLTGKPTLMGAPTLRGAPTYNPVVTLHPSSQPTMAPSGMETVPPTPQPSPGPSSLPTSPPTRKPTYSPTNPPSRNPTYSPSRNPTYSPSRNPTYSPSRNPTYSPTNGPSKKPTYSQTYTPTKLTTLKPSPPNVDQTIIIVLAVLLALMVCFVTCLLWFIQTLLRQKGDLVPPPPPPLPPPLERVVEE